MKSRKLSETIEINNSTAEAVLPVEQPLTPWEPFWAQQPQFDLKSGKYLKIWQGPQHPGVTGNMALELTLEGDVVRQCRTHVGYLHRGFEKLMERRKYIQCFPIVCRICVPEPDYNEYLFAAAVEELTGVEIPEKAAWIRAFTLELIRMASLTMGLGGQAGSFGLVPAILCWICSRNSPAAGCITCTSSPGACGRISPTVSRSGWKQCCASWKN